MGKGRIISAQGEGLYTLEIIEDRARADANRTLAVNRVADIDTRIPEIETDLGEAQTEVDAAAAAQDQAIADYQAALADDTIDAEPLRQAMVDAGAAIIEAAGKRDAILGNIRTLKAERLSLQSRINLIDALPPLRQISAWCADYTEDLSGDVATAEVPGEIGQVIIKPGYSDSAAWSASADGAIQPALSGTPAGVFYNLAMMPGWQKWRPTFRIATISNISNDLCDIALIPASSSQQNLNVNMASAYDGVPIMYMDCNGDAFENGDRVLVAFSGNTGQPVVVGFEKDPAPCRFFGVIISPIDYLSEPSRESTRSDYRLRMGVVSSVHGDGCLIYEPEVDPPTQTVTTTDLFDQRHLARPFTVNYDSGAFSDHDIINGNAETTVSTTLRMIAERATTNGLGIDASGYYLSGTGCSGSGPGIDAVLANNSASTGLYRFSGSAVVNDITIDWKREFTDSVNWAFSRTVTEKRTTSSIIIGGDPFANPTDSWDSMSFTSSEILEICGVEVSMQGLADVYGAEETLLYGGSNELFSGAVIPTFAPIMHAQASGRIVTATLAVRKASDNWYAVTVQTDGGEDGWVRIDTPAGAADAIEAHLGLTEGAVTQVPASVG